MATNLKAIHSKIALVRSSGAKLNELIHETALMILEHAQKHGDCTPAFQLVLAMPASMRRSMLIQWFATFSPIRIKTDFSGVGMLKPTSKGYTDFDIEAASVTPFYVMAEGTPENAPKMLDFMAILNLVKKAVERIESEADEGHIAEDDKAPALALAKSIRSVLKGNVAPSTEGVTLN